MGSSPIARSIFLVSFLTVSTAFSQTTPDLVRPFDMGQVVLLPGATTYRGDLPHDIHEFSSTAPYDSLAAVQTTLVGWADPLGQANLGIHANGPGVMFENILYPLASAGSLNGLPLAGTAEIFNLPTQAWWGPTASNGAINLVAPEIQDKLQDRVAGQGGTGTVLVFNDQFQSNLLGADVTYRHGNAPASGVTDQFNFISKERWLKNDDLGIGTGFLGTQGLGNDHWYSTYLNFTLFSPNFQQLQLKPYYQSAQAGNQSVQEVGGFLNYLFNLAGLAESHLGAGWSSDNSDGQVAGQKGFIQSTNLFDALGDLTADMAFRWDFSTLSNTTFSTVLGLQGTVGTFVLLGDLDKGVSPITNQDVVQADLGVSYQPDDFLHTTIKYVFEQANNVPYNGARIEVQTQPLDGLWVLRRLRLDVNEQALVDPQSVVWYDTGFAIRWGFSSVDDWWLKARCLSNESFYGEGGVGVHLTEALRVFGTVENTAGIPLSLPNMDQPTGTVVSAGLDYAFR